MTCGEKAFRIRPVAAPVSRPCAFCSKRFKPRTTRQVYCSDKCRERAKYIAARKSEPEKDRRCVWCGVRIGEEIRSHAKFCSSKCRQEAFRQRPCIYCGVPANSRDHFVPKSYVQKMSHILAYVKKSSVIVPACIECNSTAGAKVFLTISEKRRYIQSKYREKYQKLLESPDWTESELAELGPTMKSHVVSSQNTKRLLRQRLYWPRML